MKFLLQLPWCSCFCFIKSKKDKHKHKEKEEKKENDEKKDWEMQSTTHHDEVRMKCWDLLAILSTFPLRWMYQKCVSLIFSLEFVMNWYLASISFVNHVSSCNDIEIFETKLFAFFASTLIIWHHVHLLHLMFNRNQPSLCKKPAGKIQ